jgi:hypothetical protein
VRTDLILLQGSVLGTDKRVWYPYRRLTVSGSLLVGIAWEPEAPFLSTDEPPRLPARPRPPGSRKFQVRGGAQRLL